MEAIKGTEIRTCYQMFSHTHPAGCDVQIKKFLASVIGRQLIEIRRTTYSKEVKQQTSMLNLPEGMLQVQVVMMFNDVLVYSSSDPNDIKNADQIYSQLNTNILG